MIQEFLLAAYFMTCPIYSGVGQPVTIISTHNSYDSCEKTCKKLEEKSLKDRSCEKLHSKGSSFITNFSCICSEK